MAPYIFNPPFTPTEIPGPIWPVQLVFALLDFLAQLLGLGSGTTELFTRAINNTWANFMLTSGFLYNAIGLFRQFALKLLDIVFEGLKHIISDILHGHLLQALKDIQALFHALHNLFAPIIQWLRQLQRIQRQYQLQALKRIVNLIQRARQVLAVFRLLHVKWATRLDNWLAGIEGKLIAREFDILHKTNEIVDWINWILDPTAFFRTVPLWGTAARDLAALARALGAVGLANVYPATRRGPNAPAQAVPFVAWAQNLLPTQNTSTPQYDAFAADVGAVHERMLGEVGT